MNELYKVKTTCPLDCPDTCGLVAEISEGRVVGLNGDQEHPYTNGFICSKMKKYPQRLYGLNRVLYPQKRNGAKGEGKFARISWDEALDICAENLHNIKNTYGGEAILPYSYAGNMGQINRFAGYPLFHKLETTALEHTICFAAAGAGWKENCGTIPGCPPENAAFAKVIVAWGINVKVSNVHFWQYVTTAKRNGAHLVVIDPYRNHTAQAADTFIQVKPGGDAALSMGIIKSLIEQELLNETFITTHTQGFDELKEYLTSISWNQLVAESGVGIEKITWLAELFGQTEKTFFRLGVGLTRNSKGGALVRAITSLGACLGLFAGGEGRGILLSSSAFSGNNNKLLYPQLAEKPTRSLNMIQLGKALNDKQNVIRGLIVYNANPATVNPDAAIVRQGLLREDLFTVVHEQVMTPTAKYADLLLPATTFLENHDVYTAYGHFYLQVSKPVINPIGECLSNFDFFQKLATKMGYTDPPFQQSCEERIRDFLVDLQGRNQEDSVDELVNGKLGCSTRRAEMGQVLSMSDDKYSFTGKKGNTGNFSYLDSNGEFNDPDLLSRFPLKLITPPHPDLLNSTFGDLYQEMDGFFLVHPVDADRFGIEDGKEAYLQNHRGKVKRLVKVTEDTQPGLVVGEGLFWQNEGSDPGTINCLTSQKLEQLGGGATFHESLVSLHPA